MKTRTAPWDYDRPIVIPLDDETVALYNARRDAIDRMETELKDIMGHREFSAWKWAQPVTSGAAYVTALDHELTRFDCTCNPVTDPCPGCRARNSYHKENI
jgi:hypothetical protein